MMRRIQNGSLGQLLERRTLGTDRINLFNSNPFTLTCTPRGRVLTRHSPIHESCHIHFSRKRLAIPVYSSPVLEEMEFANRAQAEGTTVAHVADAVFSPLENTSVKDKKACEASVGFFLEEDSVLANYHAVYKLEKHGRTKAVMLRIAYQFFALRERLDSEIKTRLAIVPS